MPIGDQGRRRLTGEGQTSRRPRYDYYLPPIRFSPHRRRDHCRRQPTRKCLITGRCGQRAEWSGRSRYPGTTVLAGTWLKSKAPAPDSLRLLAARAVWLVGAAARRDRRLRSRTSTAVDLSDFRSAPQLIIGRHAFRGVASEVSYGSHDVAVNAETVDAVSDFDDPNQGSGRADGRRRHSSHRRDASRHRHRSVSDGQPLAVASASGSVPAVGVVVPDCGGVAASARIGAWFEVARGPAHQSGPGPLARASEGATAAAAQAAEGREGGGDEKAREGGSSDGSWLGLHPPRFWSAGWANPRRNRPILL